MAGAGFKTFNSGDVLGATDVNTYLMQQTVMVFASAAARASAIAAPSQGMTYYQSDEGRTYTYTGSAWKPNTPFTIQAGNTDAGTGTVTVTFVAGRFTQSPVVTASVYSSTNGATSVSVGTPGTAGFTAYVWAGTSAAAVSRTVAYTAVQMISTNGAA
jgi:hypothetical protein